MLRATETIQTSTIAFGQTTTRHVREEERPLNEFL
jgi:hypothetical protein